jgi:SAM-dependent methyltransferase
MDELAAELDLDPVPTALLLDCLISASYVTSRRGRYGLTRKGRRWLDPDSPTSVADFVAATGDYGRWWSQLPDLLRGQRSGVATQTHALPPDDPYWRRYLYGQRDLARLTANSVARAVTLRGPRSMLDLGGGHGLYAAALCRRHPGLTATVLDLPGSAAVGREIIAGLGLTDRVRFVDADVRVADLGGGYDLISCFNLVHHLTEPDVVALFRRVRSALRPGGVFAVLDVFPELAGRSTSTDMLTMFVYVSSGARLHSPAVLARWLASAGFNESVSQRLWRHRRSAALRGTRLPQMPGLTLYQARVATSVEA